MAKTIQQQVAFARRNLAKTPASPLLAYCAAKARLADAEAELARCETWAAEENKSA
jgi:hypothetical protein